MTAAPDIFISYAHPDAGTARQFADALASEGFDVWWDDVLRSGEVFDEAIESALRAAKAVIVLWSPHSVSSRWVRAEATLADRNKTLVPVTIAPCERPIVFELMQTADLSHWRGASVDPVWSGFVGDIREFLGRAPGAASAKPVAALPVSPLPRLDQLSIAVLPFANMSQDPDQDYFADGVTEDIITDLSKVSALTVISRNSAFAFKGQHVDVPTIARQLNVTHVVEGSVRKSGNRVRVTAQLIDGSTNGHVWAERYDRDLDDIFALQDELSQEIVKALKLKLLPQEKKAIADRGTTNLEAYDMYLRGRAAGYAAMDAAGFAAAVQLYRQALALDPHFGQAIGGMALLLRRMLVYVPDRSDQTLQELEALGANAQGLDPEGWPSQVLFGLRLINSQNWLAGLAAFEKANGLVNDRDVTQIYAYALATVGRAADAIAALEVARAADPLSNLASTSLQVCYLIGGRNDAAALEYQRAITLSGTPEVKEHIELMRLWMQGDMHATRPQFARYLDKRMISTPFLDRCLEVLEDSAAALAILREAFDDPANQNGTRIMIIAAHAALHGDDDLAVAAMQRMADFEFTALYVLWWPFLSGARRKLAFKTVVRDAGIYDYWRQSGNWGEFARPLGDDDFEIIA